MTSGLTRKLDPAVQSYVDWAIEQKLTWPIRRVPRFRP